MAPLDSFKKIFHSSHQQNRPQPLVDPRNLPYPVTVKARDFSHEAAYTEAPAKAFDEALAAKINKARLEHVDCMGLPLERKSVIDVGCGVGHHCGVETRSVIIAYIA